jgi:hypothetical protein
MATKKYDLKKTALKVVRALLFIAIPVIATEYPDVLDLTIGGVLYGLHDLLKHKYNVKLPFVG